MDSAVMFEEIIVTKNTTLMEYRYEPHYAGDKKIRIKDHLTTPSSGCTSYKFRKLKIHCH